VVEGSRDMVAVLEGDRCPLLVAHVHTPDGVPDGSFQLAASYALHSSVAYRRSTGNGCWALFDHKQSCELRCHSFRRLDQR
jgi:hypothetical protein